MSLDSIQKKRLISYSMTTIFENTVLTYVRIKITSIMILLYLRASFIKVGVCKDGDLEENVVVIALHSQRSKTP